MSYNSLFGLGSHSPDAALEGWWKLDDNAASTVVTDYSGKGNHGTLEGGRNTADLASASISQYLGSSLDFNGTSDYISLPFNFTSYPYTMGARARHDGSGGDFLFSQGRSDVTNVYYAVTTFSSNYTINVRNTINRRVLGTTVTGGVNHLAGVFDGNNSQQLWVDGTNEATQTITTTQNSSVDRLAIGGLVRTGDSNHWLGPISDFFAFSRSLAGTELQELDAGPEPINLTAPVLSQSTYTISTTDGTWDSQANGVVNYSYSWEYADDASGTNPVAISVTASEFGPTPAMSGKFVRVTVSASNDGGSDPAEDQVSAWTAITAVPRGLGKEVAHWCPSWKDDSAESVVTDYTLNGYDMNTVNMGSGNWIADTSEGGVRALDFNGTNEYCQTDLNNVPYSSLDAQLQTSVSVWVYGELVSGNGNPWAYAKTQGGSSTRRVGYRLADRGADEAAQCVFASQDNNTNAQVAIKTTNGSQPRSTWYHLYAEFEKSAVGNNQNGSTRLWIDGVYIGEDSNTDGIFNNESLHKMFLGQNTRTAGNLETTYFDGRLDDIRFFGEHLTQDEITHLASARGVEGAPGGGVPTTANSHYYLTQIQSVIA